jgi:hypothetical protein
MRRECQVIRVSVHFEPDFSPAVQLSHFTPLLVKKYTITVMDSTTAIEKNYSAFFLNSYNIKEN